MRIKVLFFGLLKDICGRAEDGLDLPSGASVRAVFDHYAALYPRLAGMAPSIVLARNQEFSAPGELLADGDEVALLPRSAAALRCPKSPTPRAISSC